MARKKPLIPLVAGIFIGLAAGYGGGYLYFENRYADTVADWQLTEVVAANQDLEAGRSLDFEVVVRMDIPYRYRPERYITKEQFMNLIGRKLAFPVERGNILLHSMIAPAKQTPGETEGGP